MMTNLDSFSKSSIVARPARLVAVLLAVVLLFLATFSPVRAAACGNLVCETGEDRGNCPSDCCARVKNGICNFVSQCLSYDPDCCASGGCASSEYACSASTRQACYPGYCSGGACASSCSSYTQCASGYCSGSPKTCVPNAAKNGVPADGTQSCSECYSGGVCSSCSPCLSLKSQGYGVYKGDALIISYEISNGCGFALSSVNLLVSGPLRKYATLSTQSFSSMASLETKRFSVTVSDIPAASYANGAMLYGDYELKISATSGGGGQQAAGVSYVFVLPSTVFSSGMNVPTNRIVGHSVRETLMKQDIQTVPVELEVWAW